MTRVQRRVALAVALALMLPHTALAKEAVREIISPDTWGSNLSDAFGTISQDYKNYYSPDSLLMRGVGLGGAAILANTSADREFARTYQQALRSDHSDNFYDGVRPIGYPVVQFPIYAGAYVLGEFNKESVFFSRFREWADRSVRTYAVGGPDVLLFQNWIGSHRPNEGSSVWHSFDDNNGVSGEAFAGAVPFISAAKMTDNFYLKMLLYAGSTLVAVSRVNSNKHYLSQAALGWWIAYFAESSIDKTNQVRLSVSPGGAEVSVLF